MKVDMVVIRHPNAGASDFIAKNVNSVVINAGDGSHEHPTQALLDAYSIRNKLGLVENKNILIVGDVLHSRVALSNIFCLQKLGATVKVCGPSTLIPRHIHTLGVEHIADLKDGLEWCDVVNILRIQLERQNVKYIPTLREYSMYYGVNREILNSINKKIVIMHPGPINRGIEVSSDVVDSKQSIVLDQVENGVAIRMAVLYLLASKIQK